MVGSPKLQKVFSHLPLVVASHADSFGCIQNKIGPKVDTITGGGKKIYKNLFVIVLLCYVCALDKKEDIIM